MVVPGAVTLVAPCEKRDVTGWIQPHMQGRDEGLLWPPVPAIP